MNDESLLETMVLACEDIGKFLDREITAFYADRKTQGAVMHCLLVIGEACKRISHVCAPRIQKSPGPTVPSSGTAPPTICSIQA